MTNQQTIKNHITITDAIIWRTDKIMMDVDPGDLSGTTQAQAQVMELLACIPDELTRQNYFDNILSARKWKAKKQLQQLLDKKIDKKAAAAPTTSIQDDQEYEMEDDSKRPKWITPANYKEYQKKGYFVAERSKGDQQQIGFYSLNVYHNEDGTTSYSAVEITNFVVHPLFHIYAGTQSRYLVKVNNGYTVSSLDVPAAKIPSIEQFQGIAVSEGNFIIFGSKTQWLRIASDLLSQFPRCTELADLGYIEHGFFAYSDYIFLPGVGKIEVDNYGIFQYKKDKFLLPQQCEVYRDLQKTAGDPFENDRFLTYRQSPISFQEWAAKMNTVFGIQSAIGIAWAIFCLFRDVVMQTTSTAPHFYLYGPTGSGKSAMANAINSLFYVGRKPFIAYEGTIFAFYAYLGRFRNAPAFINEFDIATTDMDRIQTVKGVFDGEGRERGRKDGGKRGTEIQQINSGLMLVGQYLMTVDDNAVLNRSIIEAFLPNDSRSVAQVNAFQELEAMHKEGITSLLCDLLNMRAGFEKDFRENYLKQLREWINISQQQGKPLVQRIMQNYCMMATCYKMLADHFPGLPVTASQLTEYCLSKAREWSRFVSSSDTLSEFWKFLSYMFDSGLVVSGWDFIVETVFSLELRNGQKKIWDNGEKVLFLRMNTVHKHYQKEYRTRNNKEAMSQENLEHYFNSKKYFIGKIKQKKFRRAKLMVKENVKGQPFSETDYEHQNTSCLTFLYSDIAEQVDGFNLLREDMPEEFNDKAPEKVETWKPAENGDLFENTNRLGNT